MVTISVRELRDEITGYSRTGRNVWQQIERELRGSGIGVFGKDPESNSQTEAVRLYSLDSPVGQIIDAVLHPTSTGDRLLKHLARQLQ